MTCVIITQFIWINLSEVPLVLKHELNNPNSEIISVTLQTQIFFISITFFNFFLLFSRLTEAAKFSCDEIKFHNPRIV